MKKIYLIMILFLSIGNLNAQINTDSSLFAFLPFNGNANDESGNLNHGTVYEAVLTADRFNKDSSAFEFNGYSSYITIPDSPGLQSPTNELTQLAWIYIYGWSQVGAAFGPVLMKSNSGDNAFQYRLSVSESGVNTAINNWGNAVTVFDTLNFNTWYMIASTLKNDTVKAYINGLFIGEGIITGPMYPDNRPLEIGRDVPGAAEVFYGKIDDIRIYNRALSDAEIKVLFEGSLGFSSDYQFTNPEELILYQNHPNPAKTNTVISWQTATGCWQTLKIYDIFGKEIATLVDEYKPAGKYEVVFNTAQESNPAIAGGIYFYQLKAGSFILTKKMILTK